MMLAVGFIAIALVAALYVLAVLTPKRDRTMRSKERALRIVTPADERAARECADIKGPRKSGYEFGQFDHEPTISYDSFPVATPSESSTPDDDGAGRAPQQSAEGAEPSLSGQSGGGA